MVYPNYKNKHLEEALFDPKDFISYFSKTRVKFPKKYIITYQRSSRNYFVRRYKPKKIPFSKQCDFYWYKDMGLIFMKGIGAPNAVTVFEELIAFGGKTFLNIGTAGGLHHEGNFLCNKALRDEGTSYHYAAHEKFSYPDENLTKKLRKSMNNSGLEFFEGTTWTIDAPYRETKAEVEKFAKKGIATVEMEASALFAVAKYRKVKIAAAFVVSDVLKDAWEPNFHKFNVKRNLNLLIDAAVKTLS